MKCTIPEISWHNRDPVLSVDIQALNNEGFYRLASGGTDSHVLIWHLKILDTGATSVEAVSDLTRHQRAVNVVRWSPSGQYLASGDDDANIIIWQQKADDLAIMLDGDNNDKEKWSVFKVLRGHKEDVYDICWSPDSLKLVSGSVDNTAIIWDLTKGVNENILKDHKGFVQGVSWDPVGQYIATLSSDRICRVFNDTGKQVKARVSKGCLSVPDSHPLHGQVVRYYHDDTLKSFFRRLTFSPDGNLVITPAGYLEMGPNSKNLYTTYIYTTSSLTQPAVVLPSPGQYTIAVRCCPLLFELWPNGPEPAIGLPYRMVMAVATRSSVILYDTQQTTPFAIISNIHYTRLTDVTWSNDGRLLAVSSTDGFCSLVTFEPNELGKEYVKEEEIVEEEPSTELNETCEEIMDTSLNVSVEVELKEKKPSFLEQWASKSAKKVNKVENESKTIIVNNDDDDDVIIIEPESEKENKNKENVINLVQEEENKTILKKEESKVDTSLKPEVSKSENTTSREEPKPAVTPNKNNSIKSQKNSTPAKPIAVRRKPRSDQMNITQFLKSPKSCSSKTTTETSKTAVPVVLISEDSVARDAWMCEDKLETKEVKLIESSSHNTDQSASTIIKTDVIPVENTQDIKLVLEESTMHDIKENTIAKETSKSKECEEKMDLDQEPECQVIENEKQDKNKMDIDSANGESRTSDNNVSLTCEKSDISMDVEKNPPTSKLKKSASSNEKSDSIADKKNEQKTAIPTLFNKDPQKKRIPLITLSSPKQKKKPL